MGASPHPFLLLLLLGVTMTKPYLFITISTIITLSIGIYIWDRNNHINQAISHSSESNGTISNIANPFSSSNSAKTILDTVPTQPKWETSSGAIVFFNTNWMGRTLEIQGRPVYYQFSSGNPIETDKTIAELIELNKRCRTNPICTSELGPQEEVGDISNDDGTWKGFDPIPRVTAELERLLYEFLSNPILRQSSESCGNKFFTYDQAYSVFGSIIGETLSQDWWNPYSIDINTYITINPSTGRKELNMMTMYTLRHQLNVPSMLIGGVWWSNIPLRECLEKKNQLTFLLNHVNLYTNKIEQEYRSWK
jgi:hypothetical protein